MRPAGGGAAALLARARRFGRARRGSVLPLVAIMAAVLLGAAALSVDYGSVFHAKRRVQAAVDLAALVASQSPAAAETAARRTLADNGYAAYRSLLVEPGRYVADPALAAASRFQAGGAPANAVRVRMATATPLMFGRVISGLDEIPIGASALAARADVAAFTIGSRLLAVQGGVANAVLGSMLGARIELTAMDYGALLSAKVDAFRFLDALAIGLDLRTGTYSQVLQSRATAAQMSTALATAAQASGSPFTAVTALQQVSAAVPSTVDRVPVARLLSLGDLAGGAIGGAGAGRPMPVGAMELLAGIAELANGSRQAEINLGATVPGLAEAKLTIAIGERPQSVATAGPVGITVRTPQTRLLLEAKVEAPLGLGRIRLPVYVEIAPAEGTLAAIACPWSSPDQLAVTIRAKPGVAEAAIAGIPAGGVTAAGAQPDLSQRATLVALPLVSVKGQARAAATRPTAQDLVFGAGDIAAGRARTATTTGMAQSMTGSLVDGLALDVEILGLGLGLPGATVRSTVSGALAAAAPAVDGVLDAALRTLGIGLGQADVWVTGARCDRAVLVQ